MKIISNRTIALAVWLYVLSVLLTYVATYEYTKHNFLRSHLVECEVVDYTSKDGFFTAVREGKVVSIKKK